jgi:hypothetical protein
MAAVLLFSAGCQSRPEADVKMVEVLKARYGNKFNFKLEGEYYLGVRQKHDTQVDEEDLKDIYRTFFLDESGKKRRDTTYVSINFYDSTGKFQYQMYYDIEKGIFVKGKADL